jgi:hypothetical protein
VSAQPIAPRAGRPVPEDMRSYLSSATRTLLQGWLDSWLLGEVGDNVERAVFAAAALDLELPSGRPDWAYGQILGYIGLGDEELLEAVHVTLGVLRTENTVRRRPPYREVDRILAIGRSAWMATEEGLVHRADGTGQEAFEEATATPGSASTELKESWIKAHARQGNPGDAWDHAIKAVEAALIPIVVPKKNKPNLGDVIGQLSGQPHLWTLGIRGQNRDHGVEPLVAMLMLLWPNPSRHGSPTPEPSATPEEGRGVVNVATTIVQWARDGLIVRR